MKIAIASNLFGELPEMPPHDLAIIAGNISPQIGTEDDIQVWYEKMFLPYARHNNVFFCFGPLDTHLKKIKNRRADALTKSMRSLGYEGEYDFYGLNHTLSGPAFASSEDEIEIALSKIDTVKYMASAVCPKNHPSASGSRHLLKFMLSHKPKILAVNDPEYYKYKYQDTWIISNPLRQSPNKEISTNFVTIELDPE